MLRNIILFFYIIFIFTYNKNMKKNKNIIDKIVNKKIKVITIIGFFIIAIFGTLLHFTYNLSNKNIVVGVFSAINESVFEHIKIIIVPIYIYGIIEYFLLKKNKLNFSLAVLIKIIFISFFVPTIYYTYSYFTKKSILLIDILTFYFSILISQIISYYILIKTKYSKLNSISLLVLIILLIAIVIFTFNPPKLEIFKDIITNTYGIFEDT